MKQKIQNPKTVVWITSHVDIQGNEISDKLAAEALGNQNIDVNVSLGLNELYEDVNQHVLQVWQEQFSKTHKGSHYRSIEPLVSNKSKYADNKNRAKEVLISRLRLGKCRLNFYLQQMKKHPTGCCDTCKAPETIEHYILHCSENLICKKLKYKCDGLGIKCSLQNAFIISELTQIIFENTKRKL